MQPLLPKLHNDERNTLSNFNQRGVWNRRNVSEIYNLSNSLLVDRIDLDNIDSIPNIWARPILFEMALYDNNHLLHKHILGEWRGFLAMLALREIRGLSNRLGASHIQLPLDDNARASAPEFLNVLEKLIPMRLLANDTTWYNLYVILFDNQAIGMTSPTTLVCTATDYKDRITGVSWFEDGFLRDPISHLTHDEKVGLKSWLEQLKNDINTGERAINRNLWNSLLGLFNEFQKDLNVSFPTNPVSLGNNMGMNIGVFQYLDRPIKPDNRPSNVILRPRGGISRPSILVVDRSIANQWNVRPMEVVVYETTTLETFPYGNPGAFVTPNNLILKHNVKNDFFTDKLYLLDQKDVFPGARDQYTVQHDDKAKIPILPIKSELLDYLSPDELTKRIRFEQSTDSIKVSLTLPLSGLSNNRDFRIEKEYNTIGNDIVTLSNVPVVEVWPNFRREKWKIYYTYFEAQEKSFRVEPFAPNNTLERYDINTKTFFVNTSFPEAMICKSEENDQEIGLILLRLPEKITARAMTSLKIGVDFGTSGTTVYGYDNHAFPIKFADRLFKVTESGVNRANLYDNFLPTQDMETPFLSIYHDFGTFTQPPLKPLIEGHIYFLSDYRQFNAGRKDIVTDLKWSKDPNIRIRTKAFLEQLCLQCSAEAAVRGVDQIDWFFSYPAAFSTKDLSDFRTIWQSIVSSCENVTGIGIAGTAPNEEPESIVLAHYFANKMKAPLATGTVCIDIGGGTSDICIWQNLKLLWHASLRYAGRDLFLDLLYHKPNFLSIFGIDQVVLQRLQELKAIGNILAFYTQADALIKDEGDTWLNNLVNYNAENDVQKFKQIIAVGLSGLFYYIGLLLKYLKESDSYKEQMPNIYIGGNGSKIFDWLNAGHFSARSPINELFKKVLIKSSDFNLIKSSDFNVNNNVAFIEKSLDPKQEAAYGLVHLNINLTCQVNFLNNNRVVAGENFYENGQEREWNEIISGDRMSKGLKPTEQPPCLKNFLVEFDNYARSPNSVIQPIDADINLLVNSVYQDLAVVLANFGELDPSEIVVEPLFISELKALIKELTGRWK